MVIPFKPATVKIAKKQKQQEWTLRFWSIRAGGGSGSLKYERGFGSSKKEVNSNSMYLMSGLKLFFFFSPSAIVIFVLFSSSHPFRTCMCSISKSWGETLFLFHFAHPVFRCQSQSGRRDTKKNKKDGPEKPQNMPVTKLRRQKRPLKEPHTKKVPSIPQLKSIRWGCFFCSHSVSCKRSWRSPFSWSWKKEKRTSCCWTCC